MNTTTLSTIARSFFGRTLAVALLGLAAVAAAPAHADDVPTQIVNYADLDLSRPAGLERLYFRITSAAASVCGKSDSRDYKAALSVKLCREQSVSRAITSVNVPAFSSWYAARLGRASTDARVAAR
jgi:UrcA family protein